MVLKWFTFTIGGGIDLGVDHTALWRYENLYSEIDLKPML